MPMIGNFGVWIVSGGQELEEYATGTSDKTARFIASATAQTFSIKMHNKCGEDVCFKILIDGKAVHGQLCAKDVVVEGVNVSNTSYRPFKFEALDLTDDDAILKDRQRWENIGCIEIRVLCFDQASQTVTTTADLTTRLKGDPVHERSKKAGSHRVGLGSAQSRAAPIETVSVKYIDNLDKPYASFKFLYRPQSLLQAQGIMPPPAQVGKEPSEETSDGEEEEDQALIEKEERLKALLAEADKIKAEVQAKRAGAKVKREASPIRVPPLASSGPSKKKRRIVIDLTSDV
ncbi:hypothetical protein EUX98_g1761 [Antrodiella citrinella]|uniref:DUF7918 domain-containing protein n=1 Tax=Antrodiella citrinella TaxID=2447956 RepID=A0A4S4N0M8_9APHY|nr:hypothetical protein EUX98_g1761 [Antrodiella citrinella]